MSVCQADNSEEEEDVIGVVPDSAVDNVDNVSCSFIMTGALRALRISCWSENFLTGKSSWPGVMVTHDKFKYQKAGTNRNGTKQYWTCGEKPYCDCHARATTIIEEEDNPANENEPIKRHRLVSVSLPEVRSFFPAPSLIKLIISGSFQIS